MSAPIVVAALAAGSIGALLRYAMNHAFRASRGRLLVATVLVNIAGSFVAGVVVAMASLDPDGVLQLIALGGFAGGLTTFSTFSVETVQLASDGKWRNAAASVLGNVFGGLITFAVAWWLVSVIIGA